MPIINFSQQRPKGNATMFGLNRLFMGLILVTLLLSGCQPIQAPPQEQTSPQGLRPDAPPYAVHGPFAVGYQSLVMGEGTAHALAASLWYPALNPTEKREEIRYDFKFKDNAGWAPATPPVVYGHALLNADVDGLQGPYPLVVLSHGFSQSATGLSILAEHYASYGFIVLAPEHMEQFDFA